jgi:thiamine kinase-like enzyme
LVKKIGKIKEMLKESGSSEDLENLAKTELLEKTFLFEGYQEYFESLIPKQGKPSRFNEKYINPFPNVLTHNDCHQNNILMKISDNREFILIDNEYAGWNPMAMDLAVYINETMNDNSYPGKNGVEWYLENIMLEQEQEQLIEAYLT